MSLLSLNAVHYWFYRLISLKSSLNRLSYIFRVRRLSIIFESIYLFLAQIRNFYQLYSRFFIYPFTIKANSQILNRNLVQQQSITSHFLLRLMT